MVASIPAPLLAWITAHKNIALAYSGGLDSRFLAFCCKKAGANILLLHINGPHIPTNEHKEAIAWAKKQELPVINLSLNPLAQKDAFALATKERCFVCKTQMLAAMRAWLSHESTSYTLCDGTNRDDQDHFRPGRKALALAHVVSPLESANLRKADIRACAKALGLEQPEQKASPCLLTRFAYGISPTEERLRALDRAESGIAKLFAEAALQNAFRLRLTPTPLLQLEKDPKNTEKAPPQAFTARICDLLRREELWPCQIYVCEQVSGFFDAPDSGQERPWLTDKTGLFIDSNKA